MKPDPKLNSFLREVSSLVHVGASEGQEREVYKDLDVLWVEPIPDVFERLKKNILPYPKQRAIQAVLAESRRRVSLGVSNNNGESSSIFPLKEHLNLHPKIHYDAYLEMKAETLDGILKEEVFDALIMDVQGAELLVLKGGAESVPRFKFIKAEAWSVEAYRGCCLESDLINHLQGQGFELSFKQEYYKGKGCELLFRKS